MEKIKIIFFENFTVVQLGCGSRFEGESPLALINRLFKQKLLMYKTNLLSNVGFKGSNPGA